MKNTTAELLTTEPSGSTPSVHQKQLKLAVNLSSAEKRKTEIIRALKCVLSDMSAFFVDGFSDLFGVRFSDRLTKIFK